ncbi:unnamed protein product [Paramecium sonneborni]|uniref:Uncharacterized protein n=1 Tax=Paramecium sonneborni TaxID=65129 RepID=A0A8S1KJ26_9CILI|nr:unnamed protein product [Paramecium sonneborni]
MYLLNQRKKSKQKNKNVMIDTMIFCYINENLATIN